MKNAQTTRLTFLGLGAMGQRMVTHLVAANYEVTVWNRTRAHAEAIEGVKVARSPAEAVEDADMVIVMVRDDEASRAVLLDPRDGALAAMRRGALLVESSTVTPGHIRALGEACARHGVACFDAPVAGTLPQAEAAQLIYFVGGDEALYRAKVEPVLATMGGAQHYCGPGGRGAAMKLVVNALFASQVAVMAELLSVFEAEGLEMSRALDVLCATPVCSPAAAGASRAMAASMYRAMFPIELVEKDLRYALSVLEGAGMAHASMMVSQTQKVFARACEEGLGEDHITGVRKMFKGNRS